MKSTTNSNRIGVFIALLCYMPLIAITFDYKASAQGTTPADRAKMSSQKTTSKTIARSKSGGIAASVESVKGIPVVLVSRANRPSNLHPWEHDLNEANFVVTAAAGIIASYPDPDPKGASVPAISAYFSWDCPAMFSYTRLPPGKYVVEVSVKGYDISRQTVIVKAGETTKARFILTPVDFANP